jgi:hypothetical protein
MARDEIVPIGQVLHDIGARLQRAVASPEEIRRQAQEMAQRREASLDAAVRKNLRERSIPSKREIREAVLARSAPMTEPYKTLIKGLWWREQRRLPTGEAPGLLLAMAGNNGCGKTSAGCWVVARWPKTALWVSAEELGAASDNDWSAFVQARARWTEVDLLFVDDLGMEKAPKSKARVIERFGTLVLTRYDLGRATVAATNMTMASFCEAYLATDEEYLRGDGTRVRGNARLTSRLSKEQHAGGCPYWYEFVGAPDYRDLKNRRMIDALPRSNAAKLLGE